MEDIIVIKRVGIIRMGALGMLYGDFIAKNITREAVTFIVDEKRKKAYQETVFTINGEKVLFNLVEYFNAVPFDLIIIAVKGTALEEAIKEIKKCVDKNTTIISALNGIDS